jgi:hypothetical protein
MTEIGFTAGEFRYHVTWDTARAVWFRTAKCIGPAGGKAVGAGSRSPSVEFRRLSANPGYSRFQVRLPGQHLPLAAVELSVSEARC